MSPDTGGHASILTNGPIRTFDPDRPLISELAIMDDRIVGDEITLLSPKVIDLKGHCVIPGFTDSHVHFPTWALSQTRPQLHECSALEDALATIRATAPSVQPGEWLVGFGWNAAAWTRPPSRHDLDMITTEHPIALWSRDYHSLWLNTRAIETTRLEPPTANGLFDRDESGDFTGIIRESAAWEFRDQHITTGLEQYLPALRAGIATAHSRGVTSIHDMDGWLGIVRAWQQIASTDGLRLRVWQTLASDSLPRLIGLGLESGLGNDFLRLGALKVFMDGTLGSSTACMSDRGAPLLTERSELESLIVEASRAGWPLAVHAIGDLANRHALDAFEATRKIWLPIGLRHRIEHAQHLAPEDIHRFSRIGITCSVQFAHMPTDRQLLDGLSDEILEGTYAFRSLWDAGTRLVNGSDAPVEDIDPLRGLQAAVLRTLDKRDGWRTAQALTVEEALMTMTCNPPYLTGSESQLGRLKGGFLADLVVLSEDPLGVPEQVLGRIEVLGTMVAGEWVYGGPPW